MARLRGRRWPTRRDNVKLLPSQREPVLVRYGRGVVGVVVGGCDWLGPQGPEGPMFPGGHEPCGPIMPGPIMPGPIMPGPIMPGVP
jgi:hypothetical protein